MELHSTMRPAILNLLHLEIDESLPKMIERTDRGLQAARALGASAILQIPGYVQVMWDPKSPILSYDVAYERAVTIYRELAKVGEKHQVTICVENVWNRFLLSPLEFRAFIDEIGSPYVRAYFDVGNVLVNGFPEQWIRILGER